MSPGTPFPHFDPGSPHDREWEELRRQAFEWLDEAYARALRAELDEELNRLSVSLLLPRFGIEQRWPGMPREPVETLLGPLPIIAREETEDHYGTSGELEPRGFWMPIDVRSDQGLGNETQA